MQYYKYPVDKIGITSDYGYRTTPYAGFHSGLDLGWMEYQGENIYSIGNGEVIDKGYNNVSGNYITIDHQNGDTSSYLHLREASSLSVGNIVSMGSFLGYMGTTGNATGVHLHIGIKRNGTSIDPKTVLYVYEGQEVSNNTRNNYNLLYYSVSNTNSTLRDNKKNQVRVNTTELHIRKGPGTSYDKYSDYALTNEIYDFYEVVSDENYTWYKIGDNAYIANEGTYLTIYEKEKTSEEVLSLEQKISLLEKDIKLKEEIIKNLQSECVDLSNYKFKYNVESSSKYKIKLYEGETLIIK